MHSWEQRIVQPVLLDITIELPCKDYSDLLSNALDYDQLCTDIINFVANKSFALIETLAEQVAGLIRSQFSWVGSISVRVEKPWAIKQASGVAFTAVR